MASDGDFLIFEGNRYSRKGFLFKSFAMSAVVSGGLGLIQTQTQRFSPQTASLPAARCSHGGPGGKGGGEGGRWLPVPRWGWRHCDAVGVASALLG